MSFLSLLPGALQMGGSLLNMFGPRSKRPRVDYNVPGELPPQMLEAWRRMNQLSAGGALQQQLGDVRSNMARMGLSNSGFLSSMQNPAYQSYGQTLVGGEADIGRAQADAWMQLQRMQLMKSMEEAGLQGQWQQYAPQWGDVMSGMGQALPWMSQSFQPSWMRGGG